MSAAKARGTAWESAIVTALKPLLPGIRRSVQTGRLDDGDLHGVSPWIIQAKNYKSWETAIREGLDGAERQKLVAREPFGVAFVKRARRGTLDGYAVTTVRTWALVLVRLRRAEALLLHHAPEAYEVHAFQCDRDLGE